MATSDPIADLLTIILNAGRARHRFTDVEYSNMRLAIVEILKEQGFIMKFLSKREGSRGKIRIFLRYDQQRTSVIRGMKRISKPSRRRYVSHTQIPRVFGGMGIAILSTPKGVIDGHHAFKKKVGGELLCYAW